MYSRLCAFCGFSSRLFKVCAAFCYSVAVALLLSSSDWHRQIKPQCRPSVCSEDVGAVSSPSVILFCQMFQRGGKAHLSGTLLPDVLLTAVKSCSSVCHPSPCPRWTFQASNLFVFLTVCWKQQVKLLKRFNKQKLEEGELLDSFTGHRPIPRVTSLPLFCCLLRSIPTGFRKKLKVKHWYKIVLSKLMKYWFPS